MIITKATLAALFLQCAPQVAPETLNAIVSVESARKPYVVANVTDKTSHYFDEKDKAVSFLNYLDQNNKKYSAGIMQIYSANFKALNLNNYNVFDPCTNIRAGAVILKQCWDKAKSDNSDEQKALRDMASCYYSGNFTRGYKKEKIDGKSYIQRIEEKVIIQKDGRIPAIRVEGEQKGKQKSTVPQSFMVTENKANEWDVFHDYPTEKKE